MDLLVFDQREQYIASVGTKDSGAVVLSDTWDELRGTLQMDIAEGPDARVRISVGMFVAFYDMDHALQMFEVRDRQLIKDNSILQITRIFAEHVWYEMINDPIEDRRVYGQDARSALEVALQDTRWHLGSIVQTPSASTNFYYESALSAISKIQETWGVRLRYRIVLAGNVISDRIVDMLPFEGRETGKRFEYGKDITSIRQTVSLSDTVTALYGRGKAEQVSENGYGRKITFDDVVWSKASGAPANKPAGQKWVGDDAALALWSRSGRHRFGFMDANEIEDPAELLQATWDELQKRNAPKVSYEMTAIDLERIAGLPHEAVRLWDRVRVVDKSFVPPLHVEIDVIDIQRSMSAPQNTTLTLGNYAPSIIDTQARAQISLNRIVDKAGAYDRGIWQDVMDVMSTQIISSGTHFFTSPEDGSYNWVADDGGSIVKITGGGVLISNQRNGDDWDWRTAITSGHLVIDEQTVGQINAALIKIMGTAGTFWDNNYIQITSQDNLNYIMRYGLYDGVNSGLAFSKDGGRTWTTAVNFEGLTIGSVSADNITAGTLNAELIKIMGNAGTFWDNNYIQIQSQTNQNQIMRYGLYDGRNSGLAFSKDGGTTWTTAVNFDGVSAGSVSANDITAGTLNAQIITIAGSDNVFWSRDMIQVANPNNTNQVIRIGRYSGSLHGIAFSQDGGASWTNALSFNGLNATSITTGSLNANLITTGSLNASLITTGSLNADLIKTGSLNASLITTGSLNADLIKTGTINADLIKAGTINADLIKTGQLVGFTLDANGLTNGDLIRLMSNGNIDVGGIHLRSGDHPSMSFAYSGMTAFFVGEGAFEINQVLQASGPVYIKNGILNLPNIQTTDEKPNLYIDGNGRLFRSTYNFDSGGNDPTPPDPVTQYATTKGTFVNIRSQPNTSASVVATIPNSGTQVEITGQPQTNSNGESWYPVKWTTYSGYIRSDLLLLT